MCSMVLSREPLMWDTSWQENVPGMRTEVTVPWEALWWSSRCSQALLSLAARERLLPGTSLAGKSIKNSALPPWDSREAKGPRIFRAESRKKKALQARGSRAAGPTLPAPGAGIYLGLEFQPFKRKRSSQRAVNPEKWRNQKEVKPSPAWHRPWYWPERNE